MSLCSSSLRLKEINKSYINKDKEFKSSEVEKNQRLRKCKTSITLYNTTDRSDSENINKCNLFSIKESPTKELTEIFSSNR